VAHAVAVKAPERMRALRPSWVALHMRLAGATYDNMQLAIVWLPLVSLAFQTEDSVSLRAVMGGDSLTAFMLLAFQCLLIPILLAHRDSALKRQQQRSGREGGSLGNPRLLMHAVLTCLVLYYFPYKIHILVFLVIGSVLRYCYIFRTVFCDDTASSVVWSSIVAALLNLFTLGLYRYIGISTSAKRSVAAASLLVYYFTNVKPMSCRRLFTTRNLLLVLTPLLLRYIGISTSAQPCRRLTSADVCSESNCSRCI
jgi:hypothetical protein